MANKRVAFKGLAVTELQGNIIDEGKRVVEGWCSSTQTNCYSAIMHPEAVAGAAEAYLRNPVILWCHDSSQVPWGRTLALTPVPGEGVRITLQFGKTPRGTELWDAYREGLWRCLSLGFDAPFLKEYGYLDSAKIWHWCKIDLIEISGCAVGADPGAVLTYARTLGLTDRTRDERFERLTPEGRLAGPASRAPAARRVASSNLIMPKHPDYDLLTTLMMAEWQRTGTQLARLRQVQDWNDHGYRG